MKKIGKLFVCLLLVSSFSLFNATYAETKWEIYSEKQFTKPQKTLTLEEKFEILRPYSKTLMTIFGEIAIRYNTETPFEELVKNIAEKALKAMVEMDKHGEAFTPEEYKEFKDETSGNYTGIGAYISQPEKWILKEKKEIPTEKNEKETEDAILKIIVADPDENIIANLYKDIPVGSKLMIKQISSQNPDKSLILKYEYERDYLKITKVISGGGAEKGGVKDGDIILEVNGKSTKDFPIHENSRNIMGLKGTKVSLLIERDDKQFYLLIERSNISLNKSTTETKTIGENKDIGYIKFTNFNKETLNIFYDWLKKIKSEGAKNIVIDLRDNGGGYLDCAIEMLDFLTPKNTILISTKRGGETQEIYGSRNVPIFNGKIVALTNRMSASASEIMSGALQQNGYKIVGEKTFGKGSVQITFILPENKAIQAIKLTVEEYQIYNQKTNNYIKIDGIGINPDIECDPNLPVEEIIELPEIRKYFNLK